MAIVSAKPGFLHAPIAAPISYAAIPAALPVEQAPPIHVAFKTLSIATPIVHVPQPVAYAAAAIVHPAPLTIAQPLPLPIAHPAPLTLAQPAALPW